MNFIESIETSKLPQFKGFPFSVYATPINDGEYWSVFTSIESDEAKHFSIQAMLQNEFTEKKSQYLGVSETEYDAFSKAYEKYLNDNILLNKDSQFFCISEDHPSITLFKGFFTDNCNGTYQIRVMRHPSFCFSYIIMLISIPNKETRFVHNVIIDSLEAAISKTINKALTITYLLAVNKQVNSITMCNSIKDNFINSSDYILDLYNSKADLSLIFSKAIENNILHFHKDSSYFYAIYESKLTSENKNDYDSFYIKLNTELNNISLKNSLSGIYHENSKIRSIYKTEDYIYAPYKFTKNIFEHIRKGYKFIPFPKKVYKLEHVYGETRGNSLEDIISSRRSNRKRSSIPITFKDLSHLLINSYGANGSIYEKKYNVEIPVRATPSGGGLYPIDLYFIAKNIEGVDPGIYYFHPLEATILKIGEIDDSEYYPFVGGVSNRELETTTLIMLLVGNFRRNQWKYKERGYRITHLDCGHLSQNIVLNATNLKMVAKPLMGYVDDIFNNHLEINGRDEAVLCLINISYWED